MAKARPVKRDEQEIVGYTIWCPGCNEPHSLIGWKFGGDLNRPTFSPSLLIFVPVGEQRKTICHSFITDGQIHFLSDSVHSLAGQTVELPEVDA